MQTDRRIHSESKEGSEPEGEPAPERRTESPRELEPTKEPKPKRQVPWNTVARVMTATAALLGSVAAVVTAVVTAVNGWGHF